MSECPNLLIVHTDQQNSWTLGCYGGRLIPTPNVDRLAAEGAMFRNYFANSAVCTPSRGCLLTGRYPHSHGAHANDLPINRDEVTLAHVLQQQGYDTGYAGKWHLDGADIPGWVSPERSMGFDDCRWMFNRGHWKTVRSQSDSMPEMTYDITDGAYTTDWLTDRAMDFLSAPRTNPFFFMLGIPDPHPPFAVREPYASMFDRSAMPVPETFRQERIPCWARNHRNLYSAGMFQEENGYDSPEAFLQEWMAQYCGMVKCIDDNVGRILGMLEKRGQLENTIVVFTTDHGEYLGEHGLLGKNMIYETAYRIPLVVRWPEAIPKGQRREEFLTTTDFMPTILGLMGIAPTGREQGRDGSRLLRGECVEWCDEAFIHYDDFSKAGVFTPEYELALSQCGEHVLFDRQNDPNQTKNLFSDADCRDVIDDLANRVIEHQQAVEGPARRWLESIKASMPMFRTFSDCALQQ